MAANDGQQQQTVPAVASYSGFKPVQRRFIVGLVSTAGFLGPLAGGIYLPALPVLENEFGVSNTAINATVSVFMALCAISPLAFSVLADWKGRRPLYITSMAIYLTANILMATLPANFGALLFLRMVQAFGCSSVIALGAGTIADIIEPARRGFYMSIFLLGPNLGPTLGPVLGGVITGQASWRWTFGFLAITVGVTWLAFLIALPETLRCRVGNGRLAAERGLIQFPPHLLSPLAPEEERGPPPPKPSPRLLWRLACSPPVSISSVYTAILFANYFSMAVDLPVVLTSRYSWSVTAVGGGYLALGIAIVTGSLLAGRFSDWRRARAVRAAAGGRFAPEGRLADQVWGAGVCAAGSLMYGWVVEKDVHPAAVIAATFLSGFGMSSVLVVTFAFLTECAPQAAAGAMAVENLLRNAAAAITAVVAPSLIARMGAGWYYTGFAVLDLVTFGAGASGLIVYGTRRRTGSDVVTTVAGPPANHVGTASEADVEKGQKDGETS
ncbi:major facilitator superfamily domain-containing protein [Lasiosphaeris hirsuta]|uniref:Major facilitator superfamily domain-containing protein n=1 Tax=Lasiosphaeris hirsuta TaxID=260670 RepID=A0AA40AY25_9PEZI|nr:major facilitator superfamily domain-containing protein [Lasiosphaeris hirsuta]